MAYSNKLILTQAHKPILFWMHENIHNIPTVWGETYLPINFQQHIQKNCKVSMRALGFTKKTAHAYVSENMSDCVCQDYDVKNMSASFIREELLVCLTDEFLWDMKSLDTNYADEVIAEIETLLEAEA